MLLGAATQRRVDIHDAELVKHYQQLEKVQADVKKQSKNLKQKFEEGISGQQAERATTKLRKTTDQYRTLFSSLSEFQRRGSGHVPTPELMEPQELSQLLPHHSQQLAGPPMPLLLK